MESSVGMNRNYIVVAILTYAGVTFFIQNKSINNQFGRCWGKEGMCGRRLLTGN
jgi:hypothetical protein